uniref:WD repeat-containing protein 75 second beta-propeller domain-containing protein n=1 Tax=Rhodnius prolixus TaxID=13249 RepID=T1I4S8_RHOPR
MTTLLVDVTCRNYITQERGLVLVNTEVTHSAITCDGSWLATIETRDETDVALELRLKFWQFIHSKKSFVLNSSIELPHDGKVCSIVFQPCSKNLSTSDEINLDYMLTTTGGDKKFRLWVPQDLDSIYRKYPDITVFLAIYSPLYTLHKINFT